MDNGSIKTIANKTQQLNEKKLHNSLRKYLSNVESEGITCSDEGGIKIYETNPYAANSTTCAIIGHSAWNYSFGFDEENSTCKKLKLELMIEMKQCIEKGVTRFMAPIISGVGMWVCELALLLQECDYDVDLCCLVPHEDHHCRWAPYLQDRLYSVIEGAACLVNLGEPFRQAAFIAEHANLLYVIANDPYTKEEKILESTVKAAKENEVEVKYFTPFAAF